MVRASKNFTIYTDCANFPLDRPCVYQKTNNSVLCDKCSHYTRVATLQKTTRILIIKLGAMGDVLRTTFLLHGLKEMYRDSIISWIVDKNSAAALENNTLIDTIVFNDENTEKYLINNFFDIVINLDLAHESLSLTKLSNKSKFFGFTVDDNRNIVASNDFAQQWLKMSAYDQLKKTNTLTYQYWMSKIANVPKDDYEIIVPLLEKSIKKAEQFFRDNNISHNKEIIGINPGAGKRWNLKKWTLEGFVEVAKYFSKRKHTILLLGGLQDKNEIDAILKENIPNVVSAGVDNSISEFFAKINLCDIVLCGDTMTLHAAIGLKKNVVALFGPTSANEIEMYSRGIKIQSRKDCVVCYKQECHLTNNCMKMIELEKVLEAIERYVQ
ncbi:MAG: glycosyltransferase family 9 protein [Endomicrobium sp.]|jgi:heptosyltransferase-2|nr:glycosyltransferase family 9 protein [Endomicrobium sp.]